MGSTHIREELTGRTEVGDEIPGWGPKEGKYGDKYISIDGGGIFDPSLPLNHDDRITEYLTSRRGGCFCRG